MDNSLVEDWCNSTNTVEGWSEMMNLITEQAKQAIDNSSGDLVKLLTETFDKHVEEKIKILNFKTPVGKEKQADDSEDDKILIETEEPIEDTKEYNYNPLPFRTLYRMLDKRIRSLRKTVLSLLRWKKSECWTKE